MLMINAARRQDPSMTAGISKKYEKACLSRLRNIKVDVRTSIVTRDCFGLNSSFTPFRINAPSGFQQFAFTSDARKHDEFMTWLRQQIELEVLESVDRQGNPVDPDWQDTYVRAAYQRGATQAVAAVSRALPGIVPTLPGLPLTGGSFFFQPLHRSALEVLYTRNFEALKGVTDAMASAISRELTLAFTQGLPSIQIAKRLNEQVENIGFVRARTLARTETIFTHAEATLNTFQQFGILEIQPEVEWLTSGGLHVCPLCKDASRKNPYTIEEARGLIPRHPNCVCTWTIARKKEEEKAAA